jgi:hypothetical protein
MRDGEPNVPMFESFERFRRSLRDPEILTFDELFARASMSLALSDRAQAHVGDDPWTDTSSRDWYDEEPF